MPVRGVPLDPSTSTSVEKFEIEPFSTMRPANGAPAAPSDEKSTIPSVSAAGARAEDLVAVEVHGDAAAPMMSAGPLVVAAAVHVPAESHARGDGSAARGRAGARHPGAAVTTPRMRAPLPAMAMAPRTNE